MLRDIHGMLGLDPTSTSVSPPPLAACVSVLPSSRCFAALLFVNRAAEHHNDDAKHQHIQHSHLLQIFREGDEITLIVLWQPWSVHWSIPWFRGFNRRNQKKVPASEYLLELNKSWTDVTARTTMSCSFHSFQWEQSHKPGRFGQTANCPNFPGPARWGPEQTPPTWWLRGWRLHPQALHSAGKCVAHDIEYSMKIAEQKSSTLRCRKHDLFILFCRGSKDSACTFRSMSSESFRMFQHQNPSTSIPSRVPWWQFTVISFQQIETGLRHAWMHQFDDIVQELGWNTMTHWIVESSMHAKSHHREGLSQQGLQKHHVFLCVALMGETSAIFLLRQESIHWKIVTSALACSATWRLIMTSQQVHSRFWLFRTFSLPNQSWNIQMTSNVAVAIPHNLITSFLFQPCVPEPICHCGSPLFTKIFWSKRRPRQDLLQFRLVLLSKPNASQSQLLAFKSLIYVTFQSGGWFQPTHFFPNYRSLWNKDSRCCSAKSKRLIKRSLRCYVVRFSFLRSQSQMESCPASCSMLMLCS